MRILCIEDNDKKFSEIEKVVSTIDNNEMIRSKIGNEGLCQLYENDFDFLILDMSLPVNSGDKDPNMLFGKEILEEIKRTKKQIYVLVLTGFDFFEQDGFRFSYDELSQNLEDKLKGFYLGMLKYDAFSVEWAEKLKESIITIKEK